MTASDVSNGSVSNTATTSASNVCNPTTAGSVCSDTHVTPLGVVPVLTTTKVGVLNNAVVPPNNQSNPGDTIAYTITVANSGSAAATGVNIVDPLIALACTIGGGGVSLPTTLNAGASLICTGTYVLTASDVSNGSVSNTATTSASNVCNPTTAGSVCSDTHVTPLGVVPVLTTTKVGVLDNAVVPPSNQSNPGDTIAYTITVTNSGNGVASGVSVSDPLIGALTCSIGASGVALPTTLNSGASLICTGTYVLTASDVSNGSVSNTATTSASNVCNPTTAGSVCGDTEVTPLALLPILTTSKTGVLNNAVVAPNDQSNPGDTIAYSITVTNSGNGPATSVNIVDPLIVFACSIGGGGISLPTTLNAGAAMVCSGTYTLTAADVTNGSVSNTATTSGGNVCNPATAGSTCADTELTPLALLPILTTAKSSVLDNTVVPPSNETNPGDRIAYTITVTNSGNGVATGVNIADPLLGTLSCSIGGGGVTLPTSLIAGASLLCTGTYFVTATDIGNGVVNNTATTTATNVCNPTTVGSLCSDGEVTPLGMVPNLTIDKTHTGNFVQGQVGAQFTLLVSNVGSGPSAGMVSVTDTLPIGLVATGISGTGWTCVLATLTCTRADGLAAAAIYPLITLTVNVAVDAPSLLTNTATVSGGGDTTPGNNTDADPVNVNATSMVDLTIVKTHSGSFVRGQPGGVYSLIVSNAGLAATSGVVSVSDSLPTGLTANAISGPGWTCNLGALTCTRGDVLAVGASYPPITLTVSVDLAALNSLVNNASVSGGGDGDPSNNTDDDVTPIGNAAGPVVAVPVNAGWALLLLVLLMLAVSGSGMRLRRSP